MILVINAHLVLARVSEGEAPWPELQRRGRTHLLLGTDLGLLVGMSGHRDHWPLSQCPLPATSKNPTTPRKRWVPDPCSCDRPATVLRPRDQGPQHPRNCWDDFAMQLAIWPRRCRLTREVDAKVALTARVPSATQPENKAWGTSRIAKLYSPTARNATPPQ